MSFRLGSFIQAVTEQTYLDAELDASVVTDELAHRGSDQNGLDVQAEDDGSDCSSDDALQTARSKA
jgi:hypothetical protein